MQIQLNLRNVLFAGLSGLALVMLAKATVGAMAQSGHGTIQMLGKTGQKLV